MFVDHGGLDFVHNPLEVLGLALVGLPVELAEVRVNLEFDDDVLLLVLGDDDLVELLEVVHLFEQLFDHQQLLRGQQVLDLQLLDLAVVHEAQFV